MAGKHDANDILSAVMEEWGGLSVFLSEFRQETRKLPQGHASRVKVYLAVFQELMKAGSTGGEEQTFEEKRDELKKVFAEMGADEFATDPDEDDD